jgi:hypothetical protein
MKLPKATRNNKLFERMGFYYYGKRTRDTFKTVDEFLGYLPQHELEIVLFLPIYFRLYARL